MKFQTKNLKSLEEEKHGEVMQVDNSARKEGNDKEEEEAEKMKVDKEEEKEEIMKVDKKDEKEEKMQVTILDM